MSDNVVNSTGVPIATDELATVNGVAQVAPLPQAQRVKVGYGGDGALQDVDGSHGLPVNVVTGNIAVGAVTIADGADTVQGSTSDAAAAAGGTGSASAKLRRLTGDLAALLAQIPASLGQKPKAASLSVVLASDQDAIPVTGVIGGGVQYPDGTAVATPTGTQANWNEAGTQHGVSIAKPLPVQLLTALIAGASRIGMVTIRNAADTANIDPLAEATFTARVPTLGQKAMTGAIPVVIASDQSTIAVSGAGGGTQYAAGAAAATPTGTQVNWDEGGTQRAASTAKPLPVQLPNGKVGIDQTTIGTTDRVMAQGTATILVTATLATGGAYAAGDFVGPSGGLGFAVNPANRATGLGGHIESFTMYDGDNQGVPCDVYFFENSNWTSPADNAAWSITDTSAQYMVGRCAINTFVSYGSAGQAGFGVFAEGPIPYKCNGTTLYFAVVPRNAVTYTATRTSTAGLQFRIGLVLD